MNATRSRGSVDRTQDALNAARHICQEARVVLTCLRGGPPQVARGELAQDLMELRMLVKARLGAPESVSVEHFPVVVAPATIEEERPHSPQAAVEDASPRQQVSDDEGGAVLVQHQDAQQGYPESPMPVSKLCNFATEGAPKIKEFKNPDGPNLDIQPDLVGPFARPFLAVVMDPRAAGPHTLVALRALFRLLDCGSLTQPSAAASHQFHVLLEPLMKGVLACKFEQTDAGADEAVEMAIADLLALLVNLDQRSIQAETLMDAFNTVFVTRNTFVHSPALCYHFEDVLASMVMAVFQDLDPSSDGAARKFLEFLVNQLLHTPLVGGEALDESAREAQVAHDATRVLCLRLTRHCLRTGWGSPQEGDEMPQLPFGKSDQESGLEAIDEEERTLLRIIQDDLCLSLLMTGQAIWAYHDASSNISPGVISLEVLSEICGTLATLWDTVALRQHLVSQFETIFTGFYQRALVLLRKRRNPTASASFNANLVFDAEVEVILESLVDILCITDDPHGFAEGKVGALEALFATYDCHMCRSDVASGLVVELCRCCGGNVGEDGEVLMDMNSTMTSLAGTSVPNTPGSTASTRAAVAGMLPVEPWRPVPAHLKELCAEALVGGMKCLFRDDKPSEHTLAERARRSALGVSMPSELALDLEGSFGETKTFGDNCPTDVHSLRCTKSKKRMMRHAARLFNEKSTKGIQFLVSSGLIADPVTPTSVATFLRNGIAVGLDKKAVGGYLGAVGKAPVAGKSPPCWERDWFHKEVLSSYCSLFRFERQSLLDGLRMFLAAFRLPGEAQQIDRILQAFAESCGRQCDESSEGRLKIFSPDPKKASDAAYLLSFSIIMLNTDLHNDNIREDRRMKMEDFVKNNTDYGRDIMDEGHLLPSEFLGGIYESIREEEIRTEGEGADGHMTVERWKDVLRGPVGEREESTAAVPSTNDADDLTELVVENVWMPILSAIGALWGVTPSEELSMDVGIPARGNAESTNGGMLGAQGARLGMDMALEMLQGVRNLGRMDIFHQTFSRVCGYTGLLGPYTTDAVDRTWAFVKSVEAQSAVIVAIQTARDAGDEIGFQGWKCIWRIIFELRDLKMLGSGVSNKRRSILSESDPDLLLTDARREWTMRVSKGGKYDNATNRTQKTGMGSVFGAMGRALFGSEDVGFAQEESGQTDSVPNDAVSLIRTPHGKEDLLIWDELAASDDEDNVDPDTDDVDNSDDMDVDYCNTDVQNPSSWYGSAGANFESQLIHEDFLVFHQEDAPITGLERVEDTRQYQISPRGRVRKRLALSSDFAGLVSDSRFLDLDGIRSLLRALLDIVHSAPARAKSSEAAASDATFPRPPDITDSPGKAGKAYPDVARALLELPISPASEALAEVLICEVALKNRDRLGMLWSTMLRDHYHQRLGHGPRNADRPTLDPSNKPRSALLNPGIEKCVTGLLRICFCAVLREEVANDVLGSLKLLYPSDHSSSSLRDLDRHLGEGIWRICRSVDGLRHLGVEGWDGLLGLAQWCALSGGETIRDESGAIGRSAGFADDDPALLTYRSLHLLLHASELEEFVPFSIVGGVRALIVAGERRNYPKLSIAGLDLLQVLHTRLETLIAQASGQTETEHAEKTGDAEKSEIWLTCWFPVLEAMAEAAELSSHASVRQHALCMLTDAFIDRHGQSIPADQLCSVLQRICIPLAGKRIADMLRNERNMTGDVEEIMIEFELCISLIFKPFLHHLRIILKAKQDILSIWRSVLTVMQRLLGEDEGGGRSQDTEELGRHSAQQDMSPSKLLLTTRELASEHLRNAIMVLIACGVLKAEPESPQDISEMTWVSVGNMVFCKDFVDEWKQSARDEGRLSDNEGQPADPEG